MKKMFLIYLVLIIGTSQGFSSLFIYGYSDKGKSQNNPGDLITAGERQAGLEARVIKGRVYVKLLMVNESKESVYSLVREFPDGSFESVDIRFGVKNEINTPLLYSFVDEEVPAVDFTYALYRISDESKLIQKWSYCAEQKELCVIIPDAVASNE